jgi:hypothetical protein
VRRTALPRRSHFRRDGRARGGLDTAAAPTC